MENVANDNKNVEFSTNKCEEGYKREMTIHCCEPTLTLTSDGPRDDSTGRRSNKRENLREFFISLTFEMKTEVCPTD